MGNDDHETHLAVLTVLPPETDTNEQRIHAIGTDYFTLLEGTLPADATVTPGDRVTTTDNHQGPTTSITRRLTYDTLSQDAQDRLTPTIESIILANEHRFLDYFNDAQPISLRRHQLDLFPGIAETLRESIIHQRKQQPFADFDDLEHRVDNVRNPHTILTERVLTELHDDDVTYTLLLD